MPSTPNNIFTAVTTTQQKGMMIMQNIAPVFKKADKMFNNFQDYTGQVGQSVQFMKQVKADTANTIVWQNQASVERLQTLTVDQEISAATQYTDTQVLFFTDPLNFDKSWIKSAIVNIASEIEQFVSRDFIRFPYRFYRMSSSTTFPELQRALATFRNFGSVNMTAECFLPDMAVPGILQSGLNQFAVDRNNVLANSWELGSYGNCNFNASSQLQIHNAGSEGNSESTLVVVSATKNAAGAITAITFSGCNAASDPNSVKRYDRFEITTANTSLLQLVGFNRSANKIQFMAAADAASTAGSQVTVTLDTPLYPGVTLSDYVSISTDIVVGMTATVEPDFVAGAIYSGAAHQVANPQLGDMDPFTTSWQTDPQTGTSLRIAYGSQLGQGTKRFGIDGIYGSTMNSDLVMTLCFPLNQA